MKDNFDLIQLFKTIWKNRKRLFIWTGAGLILGAIISLSMPNEYVCEVLIAPETKDQSSGMRGSLGDIASMMGMGGSSSSVNGINEMVYSEIVKSSPFLLQFDSIEVNYNDQKITLQEYLNDNSKTAWWNYVLGAPSALLDALNGSDDEVDQILNSYTLSKEQFDFVSALSERISAEQDIKTRLITVTVKMQDPLIAAQVADSLVANLNSFIIDYRTSKTRLDLQVNEDMLKNAREQYYQADQKYAEAVDQNQNIIRRTASLTVERLQNERNLAFQVYQQLASQVELTRVKLQEDTPIATIINPPMAPISAASPKKKLITIVMGLLFAIGYCGVLLFREQSVISETAEKID